MRRRDLAESIRYAAKVTGRKDLLIVGSQAILGSYDESRLPDIATRSPEVDIAPLPDDDEAEFQLNANLGEDSEFHRERGFYVEGVGTRTAVLPTGWRGRLIPVRPAGAPDVTGWCLERHDLCAAKLMAGREHDVEFVIALCRADLVDPLEVRARVQAMQDPRASKERRRNASSLMTSEANRRGEQCFLAH